MSRTLTGIFLAFPISPPLADYPIQRDFHRGLGGMDHVHAACWPYPVEKLV